ncbi:MAG: GtrA family protein [Desulfovibrio sp.]|nr:GtrA family protein [Desulfovibrio sp.]
MKILRQIISLIKEFFFNKNLRQQVIRYGIVGIAQNSVGYAIYLFFTWLGVDPKVVVGVSYPLAMLVSYLGNKKYTFHHKGEITKSSIKFIVSHIISYCINLLMLLVFVDYLHYPHQIVQLAAIFVCAGFLFVSLRLFVFVKNDRKQ